jgi:hypothetical protein
MAILVSEQDKDLLLKPWHIKKIGTRFYACRTPIVNGRMGTEQLSRTILERVLGKKLTRHELVDHKNHNTLDNRRENLRLASFKENNRNRLPRSKTGYKGVSIDRYGHPVAHIKIDGKSKYLGRFETVELAAIAYNKAAADAYGEFAWLNKVGDLSQR